MSSTDDIKERNQEVNSNELINILSQVFLKYSDLFSDKPGLIKNYAASYVQAYA